MARPQAPGARPLLTLALLLLAGFSLAAFADWRRGLYATVLMALLQDPLRKMTEGQPPVYIVFAGIVFAASAAGAVAAGVKIGPATIPCYRRDFRLPVALLLCVLALQTLNGFFNTGSAALSLLGLAGYVAPLAGLAAAIAFARVSGTEGLARWLAFYVVLASLGSLSVAAQAMGYDSTLFGEVGPGIHIYGRDGEIVANCGWFRASEIAGWHAATAAALGVVLLTRKHLDARRLALALALAAALAVIAALTGRRKAPMLILVFGALYFGLLGLYLRGGLRAGAWLAALAPVAYGVAAPWLQAPDFGGAYGVRVLTVFGEPAQRVFDTAWAPLQTVLDVYGPLGGGLGLATQGAQYLSLNADLTSGAGEGGLGKLFIELGVPGLAALALLGFAIARRLQRNLASLASAAPAAARFNAGLVALLGANAVNFTLASQTYGDMFVLLFLGLLLGAALAAPGLARSRPSPR